MSVLCTLPYAFLGVYFCFLVWGSNLKSLTSQASALPPALPFRLCKGTGSWKIIVPKPKQKNLCHHLTLGPVVTLRDLLGVPKPQPQWPSVHVWRGPPSKAPPPGSQASLKCHCFSVLSVSCCSQPHSGPLKGASSRATSGGYICMLWFSVVSRAGTRSQPSLSHSRSIDPP